MKTFIYKILVRVKRIVFFPREIINYFSIGKHLANNTEIQISTALLLSFQYENKEYCRKDVIIRYLALRDKFFNENTVGLAFYDKLMTERFKEKPFKNKIEDSLDGVFNSMKTRGFNSEFPIPVNSKLKLLDGSHRLAAAIVNGIEEVPIQVLPVRKKVHFNNELLKRYKFTSEELSLLQKSENELFLDLGVYFPVIIWPTAYTLRDEIEKDLNFDVKFKYELDLNKDEFESYVRAIYDIDDIAEWKVDKKLNAMTSDQNKVCVIFLDFLLPNYRRKSSNNALLSKTGEQLKQNIRSKYKPKVANYIYDIIIHTGDNHIHNKKIVQITRSYLNE